MKGSIIHVKSQSAFNNVRRVVAQILAIFNPGPRLGIALRLDARSWRNQFLPLTFGFASFYPHSLMQRISFKWLRGLAR